MPLLSFFRTSYYTSFVPACQVLRTHAARFEKEFCTIEELKEEMKKGRYEIVISDYAAFQVKTAGILKRALKEIHALGGDYVHVLLQGAE